MKCWEKQAKSRRTKVKTFKETKNVTRDFQEASKRKKIKKSRKKQGSEEEKDRVSRRSVETNA
eukprot:c14708_g1_i1 orf=420-608(+)